MNKFDKAIKDAQDALNKAIEDKENNENNTFADRLRNAVINMNLIEVNDLDTDTFKLNAIGLSDIGYKNIFGSTIEFDKKMGKAQNYYFMQYPIFIDSRLSKHEILLKIDI